MMNKGHRQRSEIPFKEPWRRLSARPTHQRMRLQHASFLRNFYFKDNLRDLQVYLRTSDAAGQLPKNEEATMLSDNTSRPRSSVAGLCHLSKVISALPTKPRIAAVSNKTLRGTFGPAFAEFAHELPDKFLAIDLSASAANEMRSIWPWLKVVAIDSTNDFVERLADVDVLIVDVDISQKAVLAHIAIEHDVPLVVLTAPIATQVCEQRQFAEFANSLGPHQGVVLHDFLGTPSATRRISRLAQQVGELEAMEVIRRHATPREPHLCHSLFTTEVYAALRWVAAFRPIESFSLDCQSSWRSYHPQAPIDAFPSVAVLTFVDKADRTAVVKVQMYADDAETIVEVKGTTGKESIRLSHRLPPPRRSDDRATPQVIDPSPHYDLVQGILNRSSSLPIVSVDHDDPFVPLLESLWTVQISRIELLTSTPLHLVAASHRTHYETREIRK